MNPRNVTSSVGARREGFPGPSDQGVIIAAGADSGGLNRDSPSLSEEIACLRMGSPEYQEMIATVSEPLIPDLVRREELVTLMRKRIDNENESKDFRIVNQT